MPVVTVEPNHFVVVPVEVEVVRVVGLALARRRAPVVADRTNVALISTVAITRSREEDALAVLLARHLVTVVTVLSCPFPDTIIKQFLEFCLRRHTPAAAPVRTSSVVR